MSKLATVANWRANLFEQEVAELLRESQDNPGPHYLPMVQDDDERELLDSLKPLPKEAA